MGRYGKFKFYGFILIVVLLIFLPFSVEAQKIVIAQGVDVDTLEPNLVMTTPTHVVYINLFDSLVHRDRDFRSVNRLATSYKDVSPTTWRFNLRKGVTFHNGEPFNAECVKFSFERIYAPDSKSRNKGFFSTIDSIKIIDDYTIDVITKKPDPILPARLAHLWIIPPKYYKEVGPANFSQNPVGTGQFKFVKWIKDDRIILERNENYWDGAHKTIKELDFRCIPETQARLAALETGEGDIATNIPPDLAKRVSTKGKFEFRSTPVARVIHLQLSTNRESPLLNKKVRQAINYAVDKDSIIKHILEGYGEKLSSISPKLVFGYDTSLKPYPYDPKKAKQLLSEAGYPNGFEIEMNSPTGRYMRDKEVCQAIAGQLSKVGIKVDLKMVEWATYLDIIATRKSAPIYLFGWGLVTADPDSWYWANLHSGEPFSQTNDKELDRILEQARSEMDSKKREKSYHEAQRLVHDQAYLCVLYQTKDLYGVNKRIDWTPRADEMIAVRDIKVIK